MHADPLLKPTGGRILIGGHDVARDVNERSRRQGLVLEESNVHSELSVRDNLTFTTSLLTLLFGKAAADMIFGSISTRNPVEAQMPSTLLRWGLLFISGVFIPLAEMSSLARVVAYLSPLTYAQDLMNHAVLGRGA